MKEQARVIAAEELGAVAREALGSWQREHPLATLEEIVSAVDAVLLPLRRQWIDEVVAAEEAVAAARARCPECGGAVRPRGHKVREVLVPGQSEAVRLDRAELRCPACGRGVFPPR